MTAILDFNGYFLSYNQFVIKEYSLYLIDDRTNEIISSDFNVTKCLFSWNKISKQDRDKYIKYFNAHGIHWTSGEYDNDVIKEDLRKKLLSSKKIIVRDQSKHELLVNYLDLKFKAIWLTDYGLSFNDKMKTNCHNHVEPREYNCANDNVLIMLTWLTKNMLKSGIMKRLKRRIIVDFIGFYLSDTDYMIKELNAISVDKRSSDLNLLVRPPVQKAEDLGEYYFLNFIGFKTNYGIEWETGNTDLKEVPAILTEYFRTATHIYVENLEKQQLLEAFIGNRHNFIRLKDKGFNEKPERSTECRNHIYKNVICPGDFSEVMLKWFKKNLVPSVSWRDDIDDNVFSKNKKNTQDTVSKLRNKIKYLLKEKLEAKKKL